LFDQLVSPHLFGLLLILELLQKPEQLIFEAIVPEAISPELLVTSDLTQNDPLLELSHPKPLQVRLIEPVGRDHLGRSHMPLTEHNMLDLLLPSLLDQFSFHVENLHGSNDFPQGIEHLMLELAAIVTPCLVSPVAFGLAFDGIAYQVGQVLLLQLGVQAGQSRGL
jgi:hypothetical protein